MIEGNLKEGYLCALTNNVIEHFSDIPKKLGGEGDAFDPHELLEAALVACTLQTLRMYAKRKKVDLGNLKVKVNIESEGDVTSLKRTIEFDPHVDEDFRERLLIIANKCPIHKILLSQIEIATEFTVGNKK